MTTRTHSQIRIVLLAAGAATRFGSAKQIIAIDGVAMVRHCALNAMNSGAQVVVVTGAHRSEVETALRDLDPATVHNEDWNDGMGSSIARGIDAVAQDTAIEAAIILLADQPLITGENLQQLISHHRMQPDRIVTASANGTITPPCLFPRHYFPELQALRQHSGARAVIDRHGDRVIAISMPNAAVDIDTADAYARFCASRQSV